MQRTGNSFTSMRRLSLKTVPDELLPILFYSLPNILLPYGIFCLLFCWWPLLLPALWLVFWSPPSRHSWVSISFIPHCWCHLPWGLHAVVVDFRVVSPLPPYMLNFCCPNLCLALNYFIVHWHFCILHFVICVPPVSFWAGLAKRCLGKQYGQL